MGRGRGLQGTWLLPQLPMFIDIEATRKLRLGSVAVMLRLWHPQAPSISARLPLSIPCPNDNVSPCCRTSLTHTHPLAHISTQLYLLRKDHAKDALYIPNRKRSPASKSVRSLHPQVASVFPTLRALRPVYCQTACRCSCLSRHAALLGQIVCRL
jgi:hypothetical protein